MKSAIGRPFTKGMTPWNKGIKNCFSKETIEKISKNNARSMKGRIGKLNHGWKGESAKYQAKHIWIRRNWGRADRCEGPNCVNKKPKLYHWANVSGDYIRKRYDWVKLCPSCHYFFNRGLLLYEDLKLEAQR